MSAPAVEPTKPLSEIDALSRLTREYRISIGLPTETRPTPAGR